jgi:hypothetical protein
VRIHADPGDPNSLAFFKPAPESYDDDPEEVLRGLGNGEGVPNETHPEMLLFPSLLFTRSVTINVPAPG